MIIAEYINAATAVASSVEVIGFKFGVHAVDLDSGLTIEAKLFLNEADAIEYAAKFIADVIPAGVFVPV